MGERDVEERDGAASGLSRCRDEYLAHLAIERNLAANTVAAYRRDLEGYLGFLAGRGVLAPDDVTRRDVDAFVASRREAGLADSSVNRALSAVKGFHRFMVREGLATALPAHVARRTRFLRYAYVGLDQGRWATWGSVT